MFRYGAPTLMLLICGLCAAAAAEEDSDEERISVFAELSELDMEDACALRALQRAARLKGLPAATVIERIDEDSDMHSIMSWSAAKLSGQNSYEFSAELQRKLDLLAKRGDYALERDSWNKFASFVENAEQNLSNHYVACEFNSQGVCNMKDLNRLLANNTDLKMQRDVHDAWNTNGTPWNLDNLFENMDLVNEAWKENDMSGAREYWEFLSEVPDGYDKAYDIWDKVKPFYERLHAFVRQRLLTHYQDELASVDIAEVVPSYLLGSLNGLDWSINADFLLPHPYVYRQISDTLTTKGISGERMFLLAQNMTNDLGLGNAGKIFWKDSSFSESCPSEVVDFCQNGNAIVVTCNESSWHNLIDGYENFMRIIHKRIAGSEEAHSTFLLRYGSRYSGVYEAVPYLPLLLVTKSHHLDKSGILRYEDYAMADGNSNNHLTLLLLGALHFIPKLPYYLAVDTWRLAVLEKQLDSDNEFSTQDKIQLWKNIRRNFTLVDSYDFEFYHDQHVMQNKPYLAKFLGGILQFQLFAELIDESPEDVDVETHIASENKLNELMRGGVSQEWLDMLINIFYIYDIEADALLEHYGPLASYLSDFASSPQEFIIPTTAKPEPPKETTTAKVYLHDDKLTNADSSTDDSRRKNVSESTTLLAGTTTSPSTGLFVIMTFLGIVLILVVIYVVCKREK